MSFSLGERIHLAVAQRLDRRKPWHRRGKWLGILSLLATRVRLRAWNLVDTDFLPDQDLPPSSPSPLTDRRLRARDPSGRFNDLKCPEMGKVGHRFGRNMPLQRSIPEAPPALLEPNPRAVSEQLLARHGEFQPVPFLNLLAAAWLQFMIHDWFSHGSNPKENPIEFPVPEGSDWGEPVMRVRRTMPDPTRRPDGGTPAFRSTSSAWWDGSQIYGNTPEQERQLRAGVDGKLRVEPSGLLPLERKPQGEIDLTGVSDNWWIGLSILHTLFVREHNRICDMLMGTVRARAEGWDDDRLFDQARLVNAALMAKIHTVEWTPAILPHPVTAFGLNGNWWGAFGKSGSRFFRRFTRWDLLRGIPGSRKDHHGAPYSLTEDFVAVYRMHPLLPDQITFRERGTHQEILTCLLLQATEEHVRPLLERIGFADAVYSFGVEHPGMLALGNYPETLRNFTRPNGNRVDMAAIDILRDRERGVPRYNDFREFVGLPRVKSFEELLGGPPQNGNPVARQRYEKYLARLKTLYLNQINRVDLMIGLYAEPLVEGMGFSETAFFIFILMASRRLKSDRFFTDDYRPEVYTAEGIRWIEDSSMTDILRRNVPELGPVLAPVTNAFNPWRD